MPYVIICPPLHFHLRTLPLISGMMAFSNILPLAFIIFGYAQNAYGHTAPNTWCFLKSIPDSGAWSWEILLFDAPGMIMLVVTYIIVAVAMRKSKVTDGDDFGAATISRADHIGGAVFTLAMSAPILIYIAYSLIGFFGRAVPLWSVFEWTTCRLFEQQARAVKAYQQQYIFEGRIPKVLTQEGFMYGGDNEGTAPGTAPPAPFSLINMVPYDAALGGITLACSERPVGGVGAFAVIICILCLGGGGILLFCVRAAHPKTFHLWKSRLDFGHGHSLKTRFRKAKPAPDGGDGGGGGGDERGIAMTEGMPASREDGMRNNPMGGGGASTMRLTDEAKRASKGLRQVRSNVGTMVSRTGSKETAL